VKKSGSKMNLSHINEFEQMHDEMSEMIGKRSFVKKSKESKISLNGREREEIIEEDVWTDEEDDRKKPATPIEEMIQSQ
jgi:hypothetical protein